MQITVSGKQIDIGEAFPQHAEQALGELVEKYFGHGIDGTVTVSRVGQVMRVDISVHPGRNMTVQSRGEADAVHPAFETALERIAKRLRRYKRRLRDHRRREKSEAKENALEAQRYIIAASESIDEDADDSDTLGDNPAVIAEMTKEIETIAVSEAVMRLDLADRAALMFRNAGNGRLNVVYRRRDGNIGWIDPSGDDATG